MADNPTFQIPRDVIEPIIQAHVSQAVLSALGDRAQIITEVVRQVLEEKVDSAGHKSNYNNSQQWIDWVMKQTVRKAITETLEAEMLKHQDKIKAQLVSLLQRKNSPLINQLVEGMAGAMVDPSIFKYRMTINFDK